MRTAISSFFAFVLAAFAPFDAAAQQQRIEISAGPSIVCELPVVEMRAGHSLVRNASPSQGGHAHASASFEVTYNDFPPEAEAAFQAAVDIWGQQVTSSVPIKINASWIGLGSNILGSAGPFLIRNFAEAPIPNTWYPAPLANALAGRDLDPSNADIEATFNSEFPNWYFGTDGTPPPDDFDLTTIVLHEIGHGLGFIGSFKVEDGIGSVGVSESPGLPFVYDRYAEDDIGQPLLDPEAYPPNSMVLADVLQRAVLFGGGVAAATYGEAAPLYSPPEWNEGSSYSHLDEDTFATGTANALMTPFLVRAEVIRDPGPIACAALEDTGWTLAPACEALVQAPPTVPPLPDGFLLSVEGPNPFLSATVVLVTVERAQAVQLSLYDRVGRLIMRQDRFLRDGGSASIQIGGGDLPAGVYIAQVVGETFLATQAVTKVR